MGVLFLFCAKLLLIACKIWGNNFFHSGFKMSPRWRCTLVIDCNAGKLFYSTFLSSGWLLASPSKCNLIFNWRQTFSNMSDVDSLTKQVKLEIQALLCAEKEAITSNQLDGEFRISDPSPCREIRDPFFFLLAFAQLKCKYIYSRTLANQKEAIISFPLFFVAANIDSGRQIINVLLCEQ